MRAFPAVVRSVFARWVLGLPLWVACQSEGTARDEDNRRADVGEGHEPTDAGKAGNGTDAELQSPNGSESTGGSSGVAAGDATSPPPAVEPSSGLISGSVATLPAAGDGQVIGGGIDSDGDGHFVDLGCDEEPLLGPGQDCDDTDPDVYRLVAYDADGDGFVAETEERVLCVGDVIPDHYARVDSGYDCDDGNPDVHPGATDLWGDGLDWDCDGLDPPSCAHAFGQNDPIEVPLSEACGDAPDVFLSMPRLFSYGGPTSYHFYIGNQGHAPFEGTIVVTGMRGDVTLEWPSATIEGPLAAGEWTEVFDWGLDGDVDIVVELLDTEGRPVTDCDDTNQVVGRDGASVCGCR